MRFFPLLFLTLFFSSAAAFAEGFTCEPRTDRPSVAQLVYENNGNRWTGDFADADFQYRGPGANLAACQEWLRTTVRLPGKVVFEPVPNCVSYDGRYSPKDVTDEYEVDGVLYWVDYGRGTFLGYYLWPEKLEPGMKHPVLAKDVSCYFPDDGSHR